ncbi:probable ferric reduction oxidase 1 [Cryptomeria japonica]|uniref:probable ferric reduction oxidase 1 n=1 Tax=Cryptomeria japonica TaxID=3369 RepID=UPI0027DA1597|nr:probable ferric reduction oxidase 1 [Cryptomeria japonica]
MVKGSCLVMKVLMLIIFSGWVSIWILKPTKLWKKSWLHLEKETSTPAFGRAGADIFLYSFPLVLLAAMGAVYLHFHKDGNMGITQRKARVNIFSYPVLIRGPMGIISMAELLAVLMFLGLLAWTLYTYIRDDFSRVTAKMILKSGNHHKWQYKLERFGVRLGFTGTLCIALLFLPVSRGLALLQLIGIHFEISVKYHVWIANLMMVIFTLHSLCFITVWGSRNRLQTELSRWDRTGRVNLAGVITFCSGVTMWMTSIQPIRRKFFELFYYTHHLYVIFITFFLMHIDERHFCTVLAGIFLFLLDRFLRFIQSRITVKVLSARILPCKSIELTLPKHPGLKYSSTSAIFLSIPIISRLQWHAFSITSSPSVHEDQISVLIKCQGDWTQQLYNLIYDSHLLKSSSTSLLVAVEGPYGPKSNYFLRYDNLILIAGGIGVTPFISILQEIVWQKIHKHSVPKVLLIFVVKKSEDLSMLNLISPSLLHQLDLPIDEVLKVQAFVTQESHPPKSGCAIPTQATGHLAANCDIKTVYFEAKGSRLSPLLGTERNLWRATLTVTAFVAVLLLLGFFNSLFVYPKDHNSYKKYPQWARSLFIFPAVTIGIAIATSVLACWKFKTSKLNRETREVASLEEIGSTANLLLNPEDVHYGRRPDLQGIFSRYAKENVGSNVGVLACGPHQMQESIASICQHHFSMTHSNLRVVFEFHSINFSL